jgi:outer membrane protein TolC
MWKRSAGILVLCTTLLGCSAASYREGADEETYRIIAEKQKQAGVTQASFDIDPAQDTLRIRLLERLEELKKAAKIEGTIPDFEEPPSGPMVQDEELLFPKTSATESPPMVLTLEGALAAAAENSRDYRREKENVYLAALNLTLERFAFDNQYFGILSGETGQTGPEERSVTGSANAGFSRRLASGAEIFFDIGATLFRAFTGGADDVASSFVSLTVTQPLLRGAGRNIVLEPLTQAERDALYAIRSFERFKRTLSVRVASELFGVLRQYDAVENARVNYQSLIATREQTEALAEAGRTPEFEVDQARQRELSARETLVSQIETYNRALDQFRITLGLPTDANVVVDQGELERLAERGLLSLDIDTDTAVDIALDYRLDLMNARDEVADAERKVNVAENALLAGLDITFSSDVRNKDNQIAALQFGDGTYVIGADLDLPLNRVAERNAYRSAIISLERVRRNYELSQDDVKFEVRQAVRNLLEAEESYRIQISSLELAERRVDSTRLLQQAGRASTRDLLDAQDDLLSARNGVTRALVTHTIARLELLRDLGLLTVDQEGLNYDASTFRFPETES